MSDPKSNAIQKDWLQRRVSLGTAAGWTTEEMRLLADIAYALTEQGRNEEAITIFEGLAAIAPATAYFQSALGALNLRMGRLDKALLHLNSAIDSDPNDTAALANRGELYLLLGNIPAAVSDLRKTQNLADIENPPSYAIRARALLARLTSSDPNLLVQ
jgi:tetratricopeptide (TPR) repeat protein